MFKQFLTGKALISADIAYLNSCLLYTSWTAREHEKGTTSAHLRSAYDEDATCRAKGDNVHVGYVANLTETCSDDNPVQLIADYILKQNIVDDTTMAKEALPHLAENHSLKDLYVDGGYSGKAVAETAASNKVSMHYTCLLYTSHQMFGQTWFVASSHTYKKRKEQG